MRLTKDKTRFRDELDRAGLSQRALSRVLGKDAVTVNRWCNAREDGLAVPQYARAFVAAYQLLKPAERAQLRAQLCVEDAE